MTSTPTPTNALDIPPYQLQPLISHLLDSVNVGKTAANRVESTCAQALGSEIYVGCSNGELLRFALQSHQDAPESYTLLSRQSVPTEKQVNDIVLAPSIARALVLAGDHVFFYSLPALDIVPPNHIKPMRNVIGIAVDEQHLRRPPAQPNDPHVPNEPVDFSVIKRNAVASYSLRDRLFYQKEIPIPSSMTLSPPAPGTIFARRFGRHLCIADKENYNMVDLDGATMLPLMPLSQDAGSGGKVRPFVTIVGPNEFLILSWTGASTMGVFITGDGSPVRGTLTWAAHPEAICLDYPYITTLLPTGDVEIHSIETLAIVQSIPAGAGTGADRKSLVSCLNGFFIPSTQRSEKLRRVEVRLRRAGSGGGARAEAQAQVPEIHDEKENTPEESGLEGFVI